MAKGTMTYEDIYGAGSLDTLGAVGTTSADTVSTQASANPNTTEKGGILNIRGNFLGQPIIVWLGMLALLAVVKILVEKEG